MSTKLSIIIPVYNIALYLREALDSVMVAIEKIASVEIVCVDDGSTDGSGAILDEYAARDNRFHIIHQSNQGVAIARQVGLDAARGEYVAWMDPDDCVEPHHFVKMLDMIERTGVDMVWGGYVLEENGRETINKLECEEDSQAMAEGILSNRLMGTLLGKTYRRSKIVESGANFGKGACAIMEDTHFLVGFLLSGVRIAKVEDNSYHYMRREGSLTNRPATKDWWEKAIKSDNAITALAKGRVGVDVINERVSRLKSMMYWNSALPSEMVYGFHPDVRWLHPSVAGLKMRLVFWVGGLLRNIVLLRRK